MGLLSYAVSGGGFAVIGVWESLDSSNPDPNNKPVGSIPVALLSSLFIANSIYSFFNSLGSHDRVGSMTQLQILPIAILFLIYALVIKKNSPITNLLLLFGFIEEFLLFYLQKKDKSGIENRYYDLMLVPISVCVFSTLFELRSKRLGKLGRGVGLVLQGTWFLQMGVSFFTGLITDNCTLREKSRGDFTVTCKGHGDYHRAKAVATLQFNCHLAFMVVLATCLFSVFVKRSGFVSEYRAIGAEMGSLSNFTLDSDEDEEVESNVVAKEVGLNGISSHE